MNSYKYKPSTIMFDERVKKTLAQIKHEYNNGKIQTKTEYAYKIKQAVFEFYESMGKPSYRYIQMSDVPSFPHYKEMVTNARGDMLEIITGCENINSILSEMNIQMLEETDNINNSVSVIDNKIQEIEKRIKAVSDASSMIFCDSFEMNNINDSDTKEDERMPYADISEGVCFLATNDQIEELNFTIDILDSSNGFPGNTHEVYETMEGVKYVGETEPRMNLSSLYSTDNKDWYEFEMYTLDGETKMKTSAVGFKYKEGTSWISEDNELRLDLKLTFDFPKKLNCLNINGIPKTNFQTDYPIIKEIIIKDDYAGVQVIKYGDYLLENTIINFKPQIVKEVIIRLSQNDSVLTRVARTYSLLIDPVNIPYYTSDRYKEYVKIDKPTISIENLGLSYDVKNKSIKYPSSTSVNSFLNKEYIKSNLFFSNINSEDNSKLFSETVNAYRYKIGISHIGFMYNEYTDCGMYISKDFTVDKPIKKITLNAIDKVPESFKKDENNKNDFINYYIGFDDDEEWHRIYPRSSHISGPCSVVINSYLSIESRNHNVLYIDRLIDPTSFKVKIELYRHKDIINETPIINEYNLNV
ncbi:hypothetical protein, partial [Romboutsia sp.]|uniref:hypothetical protein n=1 Tax=Romboutsia sp. TaxID=1965302 RepID=UPI003F38F1E1